MPAPGMLQGKSLSIPAGKLKIWFTISPSPAVEKIFSNRASAPGFDLPRCCCWVQTVPVQGTPVSTQSIQNTKHPSETPAAPRPDFLPTTSASSVPQRKKKPRCFFGKKQSRRGWGRQTRTWPSIPIPETSRRQQAAAGWMRSGSRAALRPRSPLPGEGGRGELLTLGQISKGFLALAGKSPERGLCSGSFSCLIKSGIRCNPIAGNAWSKFTASTAGTDPALQDNEISRQT